MNFNPDPTKQVQEIFFSRKSHFPKYPEWYFNNLAVEKVKTQKHLGLKLKESKNVREYLEDKFAV